MSLARAAAVGALALALALPPSARADCDAKAISSLVSTAETAFRHMDATLFEQASAELDRTLACQTEPLSAIQVAAYHRVRALAAFFAEDEPSTVLAFQAALATMPGYVLPQEIAPDGHPLRKLFDDAKLFSAGEAFELPEPVDGWVTVDGTRTRTAPAARPFVFQWLSSAGQVRETQYVSVGTPVPTYAVAPVPSVDLDSDTTVTRPKREHKVSAALVGAGLAVGALAGGAYGGAFALRGQYDDAVLEGDEGRIRSLYAATNGTLGGSAGLAVLGTTLLIVGVF